MWFDRSCAESVIINMQMRHRWWWWWWWWWKAFVLSFSFLLSFNADAQSFLVLFLFPLLPSSSSSLFIMLLEWFHLHLASSIYSRVSPQIFPPTPASPVSFSLSTLSISFSSFSSFWKFLPSIDYREIWKCQGEFSPSVKRKSLTRFQSFIWKAAPPFCTHLVSITMASENPSTAAQSLVLEMTVNKSDVKKNVKENNSTSIRVKWGLSFLF